MENISIVLRRLPYGSVDAAEAIRHAMGGITEDMTVALILLDGGVQAGRKEQDTAETKYVNIAEGIRDCIDMGVAVYADKSSVKKELLEGDDLVDGIVIASSYNIAQVIGESDTAMIF
jgi:predicted peroxiredoxin